MSAHQESSLPLAGPLAGIRVLELGGIGPGPYAGMLLSDLGAEIIRIDRPAEAGLPSPHPNLHRNHRSIAIDLKRPESAGIVQALGERADAVIEGFRPGVAERLHIGPDALLARNPRLVYGRMTGWGQDGPLAQQPGHDINYVALSGALAAIGPAEEPVVPLNLVGDMGAGGMLLAMALLGGIVHVRSGGRGQVVDTAMCDGAVSLMALVHEFGNAGRWSAQRQDNAIDGGSPLYGVYPCADGRFLALGIAEESTYRALLETLDLVGHPDFGGLRERSRWPAMRAALAGILVRKDRDEWEKVFAGVGTCVTPVLSMSEAPLHPHLASRGSFLSTEDGTLAPAPVPRYSLTRPPKPRAAPVLGRDTDEVLAEVGFAPERIAELRADGAVA